jgi:hypothetical protein
MASQANACGHAGENGGSWRRRRPKIKHAWVRAWDHRQRFWFWHGRWCLGNKSAHHVSSVENSDRCNAYRLSAFRRGVRPPAAPPSASFPAMLYLLETGTPRSSCLTFSAPGGGLWRRRRRVFAVGPLCAALLAPDLTVGFEKLLSAVGCALLPTSHSPPKAVLGKLITAGSPSRQKKGGGTNSGFEGFCQLLCYVTATEGDLAD